MEQKISQSEEIIFGNSSFILRDKTNKLKYYSIENNQLVLKEINIKKIGLIK